jgi:primosomal protein N' (replication factor Y) (superfamily II helicase)
MAATAMKILEVIPIARGVGAQVLSYFSLEARGEGSIIFVPLRNREVPGLILREEDAHEMKSTVRGMEFQLKKVSNKRALPLFSPALIHAADKTATFYATTTGAVLSALLPQKLLECVKTFKLAEGRWGEKVERSRTLSDVLIFQADDEERLARYKSIIRECFARKESVFIAVPTLIDATRLYEHLSRGVEEFTFLLHSALTVKEMKAALTRALTSEHPVLIIGTPAFVSVERPDMRTIIVERENASAYKIPARPYLDFRRLIEYYALKRGIRLIFGGLPLRLETISRYETHDVGELTVPIFRLLRAAPAKLIDMRRTEEKRTRFSPPASFEILSPELLTTIETSVREGDRMLLFAARRGLAPVTVCQDCGATVRAEDNLSPMTLYKGPRGNIFVSHVTGEMRDAHERCRICKSWRLQELGIGIERIEEAVAKRFPTAQLLRVDKETTGTHKQVRDAVKRFFGTPGSILIGTERVLAYLREPLEHCAVVSVDSLLSLPEWKIAEKTFSMLLKMRALAQKSYLIQTRAVSRELIENALEGNIADFVRRELALRKRWHYPPFAVLIKLSVSGSLERVSNEMRALLERFEPFGLEPYPAPLSLGRNRFVFHALMRRNEKRWPEHEVLEALQKLPPHMAIDINPENLLS